MPYSYYPGCSLHSTSRAYDKSMRAVFRALGEDLTELDDWNCCGATVYMSVKETVAFAVSARNLALAEKQGHDLVVPCSACYTVLNKTRRLMQEMPELRAEVDEALSVANLHPRYSVRVRHPLEVLMNDVGLERLVQARKRSLEVFRLACYYGCQILRPERALDDDPEVPMSLDRLMEAFGARTVDFPAKTRCCGGMLMTTFQEVALGLVDEILDWATLGGANAIVTVCPLCQINLELYQDRLIKENGRGARLPILFFTQVVGLGLGCTPDEVGLNYQIIPVPPEYVVPMEVGSHA